MKTPEEVEAEFRKDLNELLKKYSCSISVIECNWGYETYVKGIEFYFMGSWDEEGNPTSPTFDLQFPTMIDAEEDS